MGNLTRSKTKELFLAKLIIDNRPDLLVLTETELPATDNITYPGYVSFLAPASSLGTIRLAILARKDIASTIELLQATPMDIWLTLPTLNLGIAGVYRQWSESSEKDALTAFHKRCSLNATKAGRIFISGDFNLAYDRRGDTSYSRSCMLRDHITEMSSTGLEFVGPFSPTYFSHGTYRGAKRLSILDHGYAAGLAPAAVEVLDAAASDHRPVVFYLPSFHSGTSPSTRLARSLKKVDTATYCATIDANLPPDLFSCTDVNTVHESIVSAIIATLDKLAPMRPVPVRDGLNLNLSVDTLQAMKARDKAAKCGSDSYRALQNNASRPVRSGKHNR